MKTYPYQDGDRLIQLVEKRELNQLLERLAEARESHLAASARDVQTIQRQAILLERMAGALETLVKQAEYHKAVGVYWDEARQALAAYESANPEPIANPIDEAVKRMEAVSDEELNKVHWNGDGCVNSYAANNRVRARLIQAAKGEQL